MTTDIAQALAAYRAAFKSLEEFRARTYPNRALVRVDSPRFRGLGVVNHHSLDCPLDQLPVLIENGNTWWYPIEHCSPTTEKPMPRSLRRMVLTLAGIGVA